VRPTVNLVSGGLKSLAKGGLANWRSFASNGARTATSLDNALKAPERFGFAVREVLGAAALVIFATLVLLTLRDVFALINLVTLVYLIPVVVAATLWGVVPAVVAAIAGALAADFLFYPPFYSFWIDDAQNLADLAVFLFAAVVTGNLATRLKREAESLRRREKEIRDLYEFSRQLAGCFTVSDLIAAIQAHLSQALGYRAVLVGARDIDVESSDSGTIPEKIRLEAVTMLTRGETHTRAAAEAQAQNVWLIRILPLEGVEYAALVDLGPISGATVEDVRRRFDAVLQDVAATFTRLQLAEAVAEAKLRFESDALRDALIGSVSHELRTPLASILGSASVLDQTKLIKDDDRIRSLVASVHDQASRLDGDIQNLLNAARISARGIRPLLEWSDPADIVNAAIAQKSPRLAAHHLILDLAPDLALIKVDSAFIEQALGQLLENAAKYSPAGSTIKVAARAEPSHVVLSVCDQGSGLTPDETRQLGRRSFRGARHLSVIPGSGLGLWIANTFTMANGGTLDAVSPGPGLGTTVSIRFRIAHNGNTDLAGAAGGLGCGGP
jgi:two-component system, OmpR family, sensor histidine kinase KdpD